jgi:hypothetical protein
MFPAVILLHAASTKHEGSMCIRNVSNISHNYMVEQPKNKTNFNKWPLQLWNIVKQTRQSIILSTPRLYVRFSDQDNFFIFVCVTLLLPVFMNWASQLCSGLTIFLIVDLRIFVCYLLLPVFIHFIYNALVSLMQELNNIPYISTPAFAQRGLSSRRSPSLRFHHF